MQTVRATTINYNKKVVIFTIIVSFCVSLLLYFLAFSLTKQLPDFITSIIPCILIITLLCFKSIKAFFHILAKKPMLELTLEKYTDNLNSLNIKWQEITHASLCRNTLLALYLIEKSSFYQDLNPIQKLLFTEENEDGICVFCSIKFAQGKPEDIVNTINRFKNSSI